MAPTDPADSDARIRLWRRTHRPGDDSAAVFTAILQQHRRSKDIRIERSISGKPFVMGMSGHVSVAHSGSSLVLVLADAPIGVDCEVRRRERPWTALAARYFPADEATRIETAEDPGGAFLRHWVAKEALLKCLGLGIAGSLGRIELDGTPEGVFRIVALPGGADPARFNVHVREDNGSFLGLAIESTFDESRWKIDGIDEWTGARHGD